MEPRIELKKIRQEISQAKASKNQALMLSRLSDFQRFHIAHDFSFGMNEVYRYAKALKKLGFVDEAEHQRKVVEDAVKKFRKGFKLRRIEQIKSFEFFRLKCIEPDKDNQCGCTRLDGIIERTEKIQEYKAWIHCSANRCTVAISGESEKSLKRKELECLTVAIKQCKGCGYTRSEKDEHVAEWECPSCSRAYAKTDKMYSNTSSIEEAKVKHQAPKNRPNLKRNTKRAIDKTKHKTLIVLITLMAVIVVISLFMNTNNKDNIYVSSTPNKIKPYTPVKKYSDKKPIEKTFFSSSVKYKITEKNDLFWRYAWVITVKNKSSSTAMYSGVISFTDGEGFIIDNEIVNSDVIAALKTGTLKGYSLIKLPAAQSVKEATVKLRARY